MYQAPEGFREFPRARVTEDVMGWRVGSIGYYDTTGTVAHRIWNEAGTDFAYHEVGYNCVFTDEPCNLGNDRHMDH